MRIVELVGPSGAGKTAIYTHIVEHGGFIGDPRISKDEAAAIVESVHAQDAQLDDFISLLHYMERTGGGEKFASRMTGLWCALAKTILARTAPDDPQWMIIDGGLVHHGQSVDRILPPMPLERYYQLLPPPNLVIAVSCDENQLAVRKQLRGDSPDPKKDVEQSVRCFKDALCIMQMRKISVIPIDSMTMSAEEAAHVCLTQLGNFGISRKYEGQRADQYDDKRQKTQKWIVEQAIVENLLESFPSGTTVLDAPVGTGRFMNCYQQHGFVVHGLDRSADMMNKAAKKIDNPTAIINGDRQFAFSQQDVRQTWFPDRSFDVAVNIRITRWLMQEFGPEGIRAMLREMQRVARKRIIFTARVRDHAYAVGYDVINSALNGWRISHDLAGYEDAYRIIALEPL